MEKEILLMIGSYSNGASAAQQSEQKDFKLSIEQRGIILTPKQYKKIYQKLQEIKELIDKQHNL